MILTFAFLLLSNMLQALPEWLPDELRDASQFRLVGDPPFVDNQRSFIRTKDGSYIRVEVLKSAPESAGKALQMNIRMKDPLTKPASGLPLGKQCLVVDHAGLYSVRAVNSFDAAIVEISSPVQRDARGFRRSRGDDFSKDAEWVESLARRAMSGYAKRRMGAVAKHSVGNFQIDSFVAAESGVRYVDLGAWAAANGATLSRADDRCRASFAWRGVAYVVPWSTHSVKKGAAWIELPDIVMAVDGHIWVPIQLVTP